MSDGDRLMEEARAASALNHPNIVTVYETISADDHPAIVMEFVDGQSLRQLLHQSSAPLPVEKAVRYARQMAEALKAAHAAGITHGDIKPENILVRKDEYVKLVDFGLATNVEMTSMDAGRGPLAGTLRYLSPEQLSGETSSQASDVFSLGMVFYEMTTAVHPFHGKSALDTAGAIASSQAVAPSRKVPEITPELDRLILAMLAKNPAARPAAADVEQILEGIAGVAGRRSQRRKASFAVAAAAVLGLSGLVISQSLRKPSPFSLRLNTRPLSGEEGRETQPALSPDGRFIVYRWQSTAAAKPVTLVREVGSDRTTVLPITSPFSWLPDSERIGFIRRGTNEATLCAINKNGTGEQTIFKAPSIMGAEWSSDGERIVYLASMNKSPASLYVYSTRTGETQQVTFPPASTIGDLEFAISPDGKQVAFRRSVDYVSSDLFVANLLAPGAPRQITSRRVSGADLAWLNNGNGIITSWLSGSTFSLWLQPFNSAQPPTRLTEVGQEVTGVRSAFKQNRLAWVSALDDSNIWTIPLSGGTPRRVISSAIRDHDVAASSLGLIAFRTDRTGTPEIWVATKDGRLQKRVTNLNSRAGSPRWSPDGRRLVFDARRGEGASDIFVMDCNTEKLTCGQPVPLTNHPSTDAIPGWSADGSSVYFGSQRTGQWQVWRVAAKAAVEKPTQMTTKGGFHAVESPEGQWLYYSRNDSDKVKGVWRKPLSGADDEGEMILALEQRALATWVLFENEIIFSTFGEQNAPSAVWAFNVQTRQKRMIHTTGHVPLARGLAVAPGGKSVYFAQVDRWQSNIFVADYEILK
jgi:serine/threonine protein kinase